MLNWLGRYFDLFYQYRPGRALAQAAKSGSIALWRQLLIYGFCLLGVLVGPYIPAALAGDPPTLAIVFGTPNHLFWSAVIALAVFPAIYKIVFDPNKPLIVQLSFALVAGFIAQKIVPKAIDIVSKGVGLA